MEREKILGENGPAEINSTASSVVGEGIGQKGRLTRREFCKDFGTAALLVGARYSLPRVFASPNQEPPVSSERMVDASGSVTTQPQAETRRISRRVFFAGRFAPNQQQELPSFVQAPLQDLARTVVETVAISAVKTAAFVAQNRLGSHDEFKRQSPPEEEEILPYSKALSGAVKEEIFLKIIPNIVADAINNPRFLLALPRILVNHWYGRKYKDPSTSISANLFFGVSSASVDAIFHPGTSVDRTINFSAGAYRYWVTGSRNILHGMVSHLVHNTLGYPVYRRTVGK